MKAYFVGEQTLGVNRTRCSKGPCSDIIVCYPANELPIKVVSSMFVARIRGCYVVLTVLRLCVPCCDALEKCRWMCCMWFSMLSTAAPHWKSLPPSLFSTESELSSFFFPPPPSSFFPFSFPLPGKSESRTEQVLLFHPF